MIWYLPHGAALSLGLYLFLFLSAFFHQKNPDVNGYQTIHGNASINGNQTIHGNASINGYQTIHGNASINGNQTIHGNANINGNQTIHGNASINGSRNIQWASKSNSIHSVYGDRNILLEKLIDADERMTFEVRYGFIRLGNVYVYIKQDTVYRGYPAVHMVTEMIPNRRVPIVGNREVHYHNIMAVNDSIPFGLRFWQNSLHKNLFERYVYDFDYEGGFVYSFEEGEPVDTLVLDELADAGPATLFYSRLFAGQNTRRSYPIYIDHEKANIEMDFTTQQVSYDSPAFPKEEISAYVMKGNADFNGPFGFSGEFVGFFKDDELRIPLEARVSIFVGNVRVRLIEYERKK